MTRALAADRLHLLTVFVAVVESNGFAGAARQLGMSPPSVTRAVAQLERQLGTRLLVRTTRSMRVTEAGSRYVEDCRRILSRLKEADAAVTGLHREPQGHLTVTAPVLFGARFVTGIMTEYLLSYPKVRATCLFLDRVVDLLDEGVDVAVLIGPLRGSTLQAIQVGRVRRQICASPDYLSRCPAPLVPADLRGHSIIAASSGGSLAEWKLMKGKQTVGVRLAPRLVTTTHDSALQLALQGLGLTRLLSYQIREHLDSGALVTVLDDWEPAPLDLHLVHRDGRYDSSMARAFIDLAIDRLRAEPALAG